MEIKRSKDGMEEGEKGFLGVGGSLMIDQSNQSINQSINQYAKFHLHMLNSFLFFFFFCFQELTNPPKYAEGGGGFPA